MGSYGGTETFTFHTGYAADAPAEDAAVGNGRPLPGNRVKIVDPATGALLRRGERGEIATKGPTLMMGYLGQAAEDYLDAEGYFRSGDGGFIDEAGRLVFEGRLSEIIKTGGAKVSLMEVDLALAALPGVKLAKSVGVPHESLDEMLVACVVADEGGCEEAALREALKGELASYKIPRRIVFLDEADIPMTGTGKIRLADLRKLAIERL
jgi:fatty-acyl-CoA synthase